MELSNAAQWEQTASALSAALEVRVVAQECSARGRIGTLELELSERAQADGVVTRIRVIGANLGRQLSVSPGSARGSATALETGDPVFDHSLVVQVPAGSRAMAVALLGGANRRRLLALARGSSLSLCDGALTSELSGALASVADRLEEMVRRCLDIARALLLDGHGVAAALAHNACTDAHSVVRLRNLEALGTAFRGTPFARGAGAAALADADARIRSLGAAMASFSA